MIVFTPDGRGKIFNDKRCIEQVQQTMGTTSGFDIVYDSGTNVLDVGVNDGSQKPEKLFWNRISRHTHRTLGESL